MSKNETIATKTFIIGDESWHETKRTKIFFNFYNIPYHIKIGDPKSCEVIPPQESGVEGNEGYNPANLLKIKQYYKGA